MRMEGGTIRHPREANDHFRLARALGVSVGERNISVKTEILQ